MGLFDETKSYFNGWLAKEGLPEETRAKLKLYKDEIPVYQQDLADEWEKLKGKTELSDADYKELYDILKNSELSEIADFNEVIPGVHKDIEPGIIDRNEIYHWGEDLDLFAPRIPGTKGIDDTNDYLEDKLKGFGLDTWREPINFRGVFFKKWSFETKGEGGQTYTVFPENNVGFGDVEAEIVYAGKGSEEEISQLDVKGKILLENWGVLWEHEGPCGLRERYGLLHLYDVAYAHGAAGIVGYFEDTPGNTVKLLEPGIKPTGGSNIWGRVQTGQHNQFALPAVNIGREDGLRLKAQLEQGKVTGHLVVDGIRKVSTTQTLVGILPGKTDKILAVGAHSCTAFEGAVCDTIGLVGSLAIAKYFSSIPVEKREKTLLFFFDSFHVWGNCNQTAIELLHRNEELASKIEALLWLDHYSDGNPKTPRAITASENPVLWPLETLLQAKWGISPQVLPISRVWSVCASGEFERRGIPIMTAQALNEETLTPEDNWYKFDPDVVLRDTLYHINLAEAIQDYSIERNEPGEPLGGCGCLFTDLTLPEYPEGESYVQEPYLPLYVGGEDGPIRILTTREEKETFIRQRKL